ncbi:hypothetical protein [Kineococcus rhizosphaerae]|uniref:Uncharacterized protein n=1 Tax=Kineococcus rhizosphaerae TaxID=559628 RepID=A0A2T0R398_9ACTN|nr:hypothetical protein [Kineococcus rhizosphaerae]PRY14537.1 hypothetical protein CLV37_10695 [Kineococcus rhizosphaerae]
MEPRPRPGSSGQAHGLSDVVRAALTDPHHPGARSLRRTLLDLGWSPPPARPAAPRVPGEETALVELLAAGFSAHEAAAQLDVPLRELGARLTRLRLHHGCTGTATALRRASAAAASGTGPPGPGH